MSAMTPDLPSIPVPEPGLTVQDVLERAREVIPLLREGQGAAEERGRPSQEAQDAFVRAGFYRLTQPRRFGGYELPLRDYLKAMITVASGDPGSGWCLQLGSSHAWIVASHFALDVQAEVFAPDGHFVCPHPAQPSGRLERADGGFVLSGRFPYASGVPYSTWALVGAMLDDGEPQPFTCLIPRADYEVLEDWGGARALGMNSSGSNTIVVDGLFVPERRVVPSERIFAPGMPTIGTEAYGNPLYIGRAAGPYHSSLVCPVIGAARAALDAFRELIMVKPTTFHPQVPRFRFHEDQRAYGLATAKADAAEAIVLAFADEYTQAGRECIATGRALPETQDARWWALVQQAGGLAADAVELLAHRATSSATGRGTPLGRYLRDVTTYRQHISSQQGDFAVRNAAVELGATDRWLR